MKIELAPKLNQFVAEKIKNGNYVDAGEVIRDSLRRWKEQEESLHFELHRLEGEIEAGIESEDLPGSKVFWTDLREELHREQKSGSRRR